MIWRVTLQGVKGGERIVETWAVSAPDGEIAADMAREVTKLDAIEELDIADTPDLAVLLASYRIHRRRR